MLPGRLSAYLHGLHHCAVEYKARLQLLHLLQKDNTATNSALTENARESAVSLGAAYPLQNAHRRRPPIDQLIGAVDTTQNMRLPTPPPGTRTQAAKRGPRRGFGTFPGTPPLARRPSHGGRHRRRRVRRRDGGSGGEEGGDECGANTSSKLGSSQPGSKWVGEREKVVWLV